MLDFVFTFYQSFILQSNAKYEKGKSELYLKLYSFEGVFDPETVDTTLMVRPYNS